MCWLLVRLIPIFYGLVTLNAQKCSTISQKTALINSLFDVIDPYLGKLATNNALYNAYLNQLSNFVTADSKSTLTNLISCVSDITKCTQTTEPAFLLNLANELLSGALNIDNVRNTINILKALNLNKITDTNLASLLTSLEDIIKSACGVTESLSSGLYIAKQFPKDNSVVLNAVNNVSYNSIVAFENTVGTAGTTLALGSDLEVGVKVLSKIIAILGLTEFWDEILNVLTSNSFVDILSNLGNAFKTGVGIVDALNSLLTTLLSRNFFIALSDLLNVQDLGDLLTNLLRAVIALVVNVLLIVEALLIVVVQLLNELIPILEGLVVPL